MKVLVDTNVVLDFFLSREPQADVATKVFDLLRQEKADGFVTANSITDIYYITAKRLGDDNARNVLRSLLTIVTIIALDGGDCAEALDLPIRDFEDAVVTVCAKKVEVDCIVTNDKEFLNTNLARVINTDDFLGMIKE